MGNAHATYVKARSVLRRLGHAEGEHGREYKDWHIEIRSGLAYLSVWSSAGIVFLSLKDVPVYYRPGPWEQYVDQLFQRPSVNGRDGEPGQSRRLPGRSLDQPDPSTDS